MRYTAVIFDMDGTLLNTLGDLEDSVNHMLRKYGYPEKSEDEVRKALGNGAAYLMSRMVPGGKENPLFGQILEEYGAYYQSHCQIRTCPYEGVPEVLEKLKKRGVKLAIVSNKGDGAVQELNRYYFGEAIGTAVGERPGIRRKPWPDSVLEALRILGVPGEKALYVGDSEVDYETAKRAGIACALVSWGFRDREFLRSFSPDYLADIPLELEEIAAGAGK